VKRLFGLEHPRSESTENRSLDHVLATHNLQIDRSMILRERQ